MFLKTKLALTEKYFGVMYTFKLLILFSTTEVQVTFHLGTQLLQRLKLQFPHVRNMSADFIHATCSTHTHKSLPHAHNLKAQVYSEYICENGF